MSEDSKIPPPDIKPAAPSIPPVTTVDMDKPKDEKPQSEAVEESSTESDSEQSSHEVKADFMKRLLGALIDVIVIAGVISILGKVIGTGFLSTVITGALFLVRDSLPFLNGQSIGKLVMKTKAVKEDGSSLSGDWKTGAIRNSLFVIPIIGILVELVILIKRSESDKAGLRLGDEWAKTKVISVE